jgi:hypothetical protein
MHAQPPPPSSVEEIVSQLATMTAQGRSFELFIPESLTLGGHAVPEPMTKALIVARALRMGYEPSDATPAKGGRVFTFRPRTHE